MNTDTVKKQKKHARLEDRPFVLQPLAGEIEQETYSQAATQRVMNRETRLANLARQLLVK
jgi:7,8-dihydro-6-hydroxymethylpterin-pyrophosphokinase